MTSPSQNASMGEEGMEEPPQWVFFTYRTQQIVSGISGLVCLSLTALGIFLFSFSKFYTNKPTFDGQDVVAMTLITLFPLVGVALLYAACSSKLHMAAVSSPRGARWFRVLIGVCFLAAAPVILFSMNTSVIGCGLIFCTGELGFSQDMETLGAGWNNQMGLGCLAVVLGIAMVNLAVTISSACGPSEQPEWVRASDRPTRQTSRAKALSSPMARLRLFLITIGAVVVLIFFWWLTMFLPNQFFAWFPTGIANHAAIDHTDCDQRSVFVAKMYPGCPEVLWATFFTQTVRLADKWYLKLWPGTSFLYIYLILMVSGTALIRASAQGRSFLSHGRFVRFLGFVTVGYGISAALALSFLVLFSWYWLHDHNYDFAAGPDSIGIPWSQYVARGMGQVAVAFLSLLLVPASRVSLLHEVFGTSQESFIRCHRALGYGMLLATFGHMVGWYVMWAQEGSFPGVVFSIPMVVPGGPRAKTLGHREDSKINFTVPIMQWVTWASFIVFGILTLPRIRRKFFELFYYTHLVGAYVMIPLTLIHAAAGWEHLLPGLTLWVLDRFLRMYRSARTVSPIQISALPSKVTHICFRQAGLKVTSGQFVFLCIPELSLFQWHPFTVAAVDQKSDEDDVVSLLIKDMGPGTWTSELYRRVALHHAEGESETPSGMTLMVEGPSGQSIVLSEYQHVVFVSGGIGVTPCLSAMIAARLNPEGTDDEQRLSALWSVREMELVKDVRGVFTHYTGSAPAPDDVPEGRDESSLGESRQEPLLINEDASQPVKIDVFCTTKQSFAEENLSTANLKISVITKRPDYTKEFERLKGTLGGTSNVLVFACGPEPLVESAAKSAATAGWHFHREYFEM